MGTPTFSLEGKVAIVTGGKRGIGRGIALAFAEAGADVAICSRGVEDGSLEAVAKKIEDLGRRSLAIQADVSKKSDVDNMVKRVIDEFGDIDILVNNAGVIMWDQSLLEASEDDWNKIMAINLQGAFFCCQAVQVDGGAEKGEYHQHVLHFSHIRVARGCHILYLQSRIVDAHEGAGPGVGRL